MPRLYSDVDKRSWVYQGNFTRSRGRYRGPRESEKFNLQITQLLYDLKKLYGKFNDLDAVLANDLSNIQDGTSFSASYPSTIQYPNLLLFPQTESNLVVFGIYDINLRIDKLFRRLTALET